MQPAGSAIEGVKLRKGEVPDVQVNQPAFWKKKETQIPVDQLFFYNYFKRKDEVTQRAKKKQERTDEDSDDEDGENEAVQSASAEEGSVESEEDSEIDEDVIWKVRASCASLLSNF